MILRVVGVKHLSGCQVTACLVRTFTTVRGAGLLTALQGHMNLKVLTSSTHTEYSCTQWTVRVLGHTSWLS